ncbi:hypothetical protein B566_EDAN013187 [Ephemera danica]|nr:hypothetical protein B566_EDAN013187 [Ephemera danica]
MMAGAFLSASSNAFLRLLSDSPASLLMISGPVESQLQFLDYQLPTIDEEEESSCLIGYSSSNEGLACSWGSIQQDTSWRFHTNSFEETGVAKRQLYHLLDLSQLLATTSDINGEGSVSTTLNSTALMPPRTMSISSLCTGRNSCWEWGNHLRKADDRVVIIDSFFHNKPVRAILATKDGSCQVIRAAHKESPH